jgi:hypothetical protein
MWYKGTYFYPGNFHKGKGSWRPQEETLPETDTLLVRAKSESDGPLLVDEVVPTPAFEILQSHPKIERPYVPN